MTPQAFRELHDADRARRARIGPRVSRAKGRCSCCPRGSERDVTLIKLEPAQTTKKFKRAAERAGWSVFNGTWFGLCLRCAALVAKELGR